MKEDLDALIPRKASGKALDSNKPPTSDSFFDPGEDYSYTRDQKQFHARIKRNIALIVLGFLTIIGLGGALWLNEIGVFDVSDEELKTITQHQPSDNSLVFDRNGEKIGEFFSTYYVYVPYEELPKTMINAIIAIEDRKFFSHGGIDPRGILRAVLARFSFDGSNQGASTLTQQVVRHFLLTPEKTFERKLKEMALAIRLDGLLSKEKIIELYANSMFLGNGAYGVGAAAQRYFGRPLAQLETHEMALIAGLFQSPSRYNPVKYQKRARKRQLQVLTAMANAKYLTRKVAKDLAKKPLTYRFYNPVNVQIAPYFVDFVQEETQRLLGRAIKNRGLRIHTTLDTKVQEKLNDSFTDAKPLFTKAEQKVRGSAKDANVEGAMVVTRPDTGEILAMTGGRDYRTSQFNRAVQAQRQPGSLFKPVVYTLALEKGFKWSDQLYVAPVAIDNYRPKNSSSSYLTETTLLRAFYLSINTPTVEVGTKLGINSILAQAKRLGVETKLKKETGTILGGSEVNMLELATLYGVIANGGVLVKPLAVMKITDRTGKILYEASPLQERRKEVLPTQIAFLMLQGLKEVFKRGTAAQYGEMAPYAAGKTGTTNDSRDNWFAGFTPDLLAITWVGTDQSEGFYGAVTGTSLALPLWASFIKRVDVNKRPMDVPLPEGIVTATVDARFGNRDAKGIPMYFLQGQEPEKEDSSLKVLNTTGSYRSVFEQ